MKTDWRDERVGLGVSRCPVDRESGDDDGRFSIVIRFPPQPTTATPDRSHRTACRYIIANCYCQPSGQHCDVCGPAALALMRDVGLR